jgi:hypothetical protein
MSINRIYIPASLSLNIDGTVHLKGDMELMQSYYSEILGSNDEVDIEITVSRIDNKKTNPQLAYFFAVVLPIMKQRFEDLVKEYLSLSKASKAEVKKFIEDCIEFATTILDIEIPEPSKL